jgi:hypothetical protein
MRFLTFCYLTLKFICRVVFTAHVIALGFVGIIVHNLHVQIGTPRPSGPYTFDSWMTVSMLLGVVLFLGWLAGTEIRSAQVRTLRKILERERAHAADMRKLNISMVDDVLLAARNGLPVKSFPYSGAQTEPKTAPHNVESDYIGRL